MILQGDCIESMRTLEAGSVHCCVTSPPYYGLRDYGTAEWEGGDHDCDHIERLARGDSGESREGFHGSTITHEQAIQYKHTCPKCGAKRVDLQIGLEPTMKEYIAKMVEVFREVRRVLRDDGTLWLNLGDSYSTHPPVRGQEKQRLDGRTASVARETAISRTRKEKMGGLPEKNLMGIPWRVAFALQDDGWYLRQDIIWHKPNPMPESVTDRCTKAHEYIFLLSKQPKYYCDMEAIKEKAAYAGDDRSARADKRRGTICNSMSGTTGFLKNKRSVWTVTTKGYKEAHFATFPPDLIRPCILAGCPVDGVVLDPFAGAGTTAVVCLEEARQYIMCELNPEYVTMMKKRLYKQKSKTSLLDFSETGERNLVV